MPVDDAISLINRSFDQYTKTTREKAAAALPAASAAPAPVAPAPAVPAARSSAPFVPPSSDLLYLLNLLADSRQLTVEELDKVITYLKDRREKQMLAEGRHVPPIDEGRAGFGEQRKEESASQREQQELQAKILSILNGPGDAGQAGAIAKAPPRPGHPGQHMGNGQPPQGGQPGMSSLINFDSPSVQKALDNLIQSGPNLLKTISTPQAPPMTQRAPLLSRPEHTQQHQQPGLLTRESFSGMVGGMSSGHPPGAPPPQQRPQFGQHGQHGQPMAMPGAAPRQAPPPPGRRPF